MCLPKDHVPFRWNLCISSSAFSPLIAAHFPILRHVDRVIGMVGSRELPFRACIVVGDRDIGRILVGLFTVSCKFEVRI